MWAVPNPFRRLDVDTQHAERKVVKEGNQWCIKSKAGKNLGCYPTKAEALERLREIEFFKNQ